MMKKLVFFVFICFIVFLSIPAQVVSQKDNVNVKEDFQVIPDEAIRLRILAHSDNEEDQTLKRLVRDRVNEEITTWVEEITDIEQARQLIEQRIPEVESIVKEVLEESEVNQEFEVKYGNNVSFPAKVYGSYVYPAGEYEAVLITIGEGKGDNWWCVLFPPLCFLDFSTGTNAVSAEEAHREEMKEDEDDEPEVTFFLFEWLGWS